MLEIMRDKKIKSKPEQKNKSVGKEFKKLIVRNTEKMKT